MSPKGLKSTQRDRLISGVIAVATKKGYAGTTVSEVIAHAGVSRPTFYEYFADRDDGFLAAHRHIAGELLEWVHQAVADSPPEQAIQTGIRTLIELAEAEPAKAGFLADETMGAGPRALDERDRTINEIADVLEQAREQAPADAPTPDFPTAVLVGGLYRLLAPLLRRGERDFSELTRDVIDWIESYERPSGEHHWRLLEPGPMIAPSSHVSELALRPPPPLPSGRSRLSRAEITRNQRERILFATAEVTAEKGYTATTITDIAAAAHVDKRVFYAHFRDKQQAFLGIHELGSQQTMAVAASAFFSASNWPERIWEGIRATTHFHATYQVIAHIGFVEAHALSQAAQRVDDSRIAFTIFLQEGAQFASRQFSRTAMEAIADTVFEIAYIQARAGNSGELPRFAGSAVYICLAPALGPAAAEEFVEGKLREAGALTTASGG